MMIKKDAMTCKLQRNNIKKCSQQQYWFIYNQIYIYDNNIILVNFILIISKLFDSFVFLNKVDIFKISKNKNNGQTIPPKK